MRFIHWLILSLLAIAAPAWARDKPAWSATDQRVTFNQPRISFPARPGGLALAETKEFSHPGESLDGVAVFKSADQKIIASAYVYMPGLAHNGLAALATDQAIQANSTSRVQTVGSQVVAASARPGVAIRMDYANYLGAHASSAAFIKADRWIIKLRASGPQERRAEAMAAMAALLDGLRFDGKAKPWPAMPITAAACPEETVPDAEALPDRNEDIVGNSVLYGMLDPVGTRATGSSQRPLLSRVGNEWCRQILEAGKSRIALLRSTEAGDGEGRTVRLAIFSDAGGLLEVVRMGPRRFVLIWHDIGRTHILGTWNAIPSPRQIGEILFGRAAWANQARQPRVRVVLKADGNTNVTVHTLPEAPAPPTT